ncbi:unnamed protein product [Diatraea saccharalis]|uniref:Folded gastrulation N-terminal domain-containing protein n=1 Tax=Diatraea saccharalis TaxID=40085 RepID=A0A9N9WD86_9NEOP|nr:unnamed protein product [Diatraea saccharalis]
MWCTWSTLLLVSCALASTGAEVETTHVPNIETTTSQPAESVTEKAANLEPDDSTAAETRLAVATTRAPLRTLDRQAAEHAWRLWLQSAESGNQNAPPRRITTKSLFITPLVCPKGQRLDRNGCVQVVTVNKDEHERILLEQLNALFSSPSTGDVLYDYGDEEPGPLQLSIPINLEPQAAPLQNNQEPSAQAQQLLPNFVKKGENIPNNDAGIEAELELLTLQHSNNNYTDASGVLNHNVMNTLLYNGDKPKRDSPTDNSNTTNPADESVTGQKEFVYGHVNVDPILYNMELIDQKTSNEHIDKPITTNQQNNISLSDGFDSKKVNITDSEHDKNKTVTNSTTSNGLNKNADQSKLNPENDYSDIGEAIKLISRYAEVSTDDNFKSDQKKYEIKEDGILGTRTKLQYRRNKPKPTNTKESIPKQSETKQSHTDQLFTQSFLPKNEPFYRYPWPSQHFPTPPPNYPFRHVQDYWPGKSHIGGVYNTHENPRRHHHSYPHYLRPHNYYPELQEPYSNHYQEYQTHRVVQRHTKPSRSPANNQNLYSLLGLRHWFSNEDISKR